MTPAELRARLIEAGARGDTLEQEAATRAFARAQLRLAAVAVLLRLRRRFGRRRLAWRLRP